MDRIEAFARYQRDMGLFSRDLIGLSLHAYQVEWADYVLNMAAEGRNETVVVEMPRQSGKNETSAQLEVAILARMGGRGGAIVKAAPTWKPQIVNSKLRLEQRYIKVQERLGLRFHPSMGYMYRCGAAVLQFLSADPSANVVGATASLLMEVDEAQDVDVAKFDKDFSPMRASTGAPVVYYGTTWTDDTLLERAKSDIHEGRVRGKHYRVLPDEVAAVNPAYGEYVDAEVRRLGRDHPLVMTQYYLEALPGSGRMLNEQKLRLMIGEHAKQERRSGQRVIVAGLDFAGADEQANDISSLMTASARDSVALTVGEVEWAQIATGLTAQTVKILARYEWVNIPPDSLHTLLFQLLWERWRVDRVHCDATGIGATGTAFLAKAIQGQLPPSSEQRVHGITFDGAWSQHTRLAFNYLALVNGGRMLDYAPEGFDPMQLARSDDPPPSGEMPDQHVWWQRGHARLETRTQQRVRAHVPTNEGHDDLFLSELLMVDAAMAMDRPPPVPKVEIKRVSRNQLLGR